MNNIAICADCTCDLSTELLKEYDIDRIFCHIWTEYGRFCDCVEITAANVFSYMSEGRSTLTESPATEDFVTLFTKKLKKYDYVIHICLSDGVSESYTNCKNAIKQMNAEEKIFAIDSRQLSSGTGLVAIKASKLRKEGKSVHEIVRELDEYKLKISTSFLIKDLYYLYRNNKVNESALKFYRKINAHPVLEIKNGKFSVRYLLFGDYDKVQMKYVKKEMKRYAKMDHELIFITQAGASVREVERAEGIVKEYGAFEKIHITEASATVASNSGPHTIGLLYKMN